MEENIKSVRPFIWGYGHIFIFGAGAALGSGFTLVIETLSHEAHIELFTAEMALALPLAIYLVTLGLIRDYFELEGTARWVLVVAGFCALIAPFLPFTLEILVLIVLTAAIARGVLTR